MTWQIWILSYRILICLNLAEPRGSTTNNTLVFTNSQFPISSKSPMLSTMYALYGCSSLHSTPKPWPCQGLLEVTYQMLLIKWLKHDSELSLTPHSMLFPLKPQPHLQALQLGGQPFFFLLKRPWHLCTFLFFDIKKMSPLKRIDGNNMRTDRKNMSQKSGNLHGFSIHMLWRWRSISLLLQWNQQSWS